MSLSGEERLGRYISAESRFLITVSLLLKDSHIRWATFRGSDQARTAQEKALKAQSQLGMLQRQKADHDKAQAALAVLLK